MHQKAVIRKLKKRMRISKRAAKAALGCVVPLILLLMLPLRAMALIEGAYAPAIIVMNLAEFESAAAPAAESTTPESEAAAPAAESTTPESEAAAPATESTTPESEAAAPAGEGATPVSEATAPTTPDNTVTVQPPVVAGAEPASPDTTSGTVSFSNTDGANAIQSAVDAALSAGTQSAGSTQRIITIGNGVYDGDLTIQGSTGSLEKLILVAGDSYHVDESGNVTYTESAGNVVINGNLFIQSIDVMLYGLYLSVNKTVNVQNASVEMVGTAGDDTYQIAVSQGSLDAPSTVSVDGGSGTDSVSVTQATPDSIGSLTVKAEQGETVTQNVVLQDTTVRMTAEAGVFDETALLHVEQITGSDKTKTINALTGGLSASLSFDISVLNGAGLEQQPNTAAGNVSLRFQNTGLLGAGGGSVYYIDDALTTAQAMEATSGTDGSVAFAPAHFSLYTVTAQNQGTLKYHTCETDAESYYVIETAADLNLFRDMINGITTPSGIQLINSTLDRFTITGLTGLTTNARLSGDIAISGEWTPIGKNTPYTGIFDGNGYTISGLNATVTSNDKYIFGLFGNLNGATVQNLTVQGSVVFSVDYSYIGGIAGNAVDSKILNCTSNMEFTNRYQNQSMISSSTVQLIGGIVGVISGSTTVDRCVNNGAITCSGRGGGIVGRIAQSSSTAIVKNCENRGAITSNGSDGRIGGIVGEGFSGTLKNSYNCGPVANAINSSNSIGGIVGYSAIDVTSCFNVGNVTGKRQYVGGIVGQVSEAITLTYCINIGDITGWGGTTQNSLIENRTEYHVGGLIGATAQQGETNESGWQPNGLRGSTIGKLVGSCNSNTAVSTSAPTDSNTSIPNARDNSAWRGNLSAADQKEYAKILLDYGLSFAQITGASDMFYGETDKRLTTVAHVGDQALTYQWYSNDSASNVGGTAIAGATGASYLVPSTTDVGTLYFYCVVAPVGSSLQSLPTDTGTVTVKQATNVWLTEPGMQNNTVGHVTPQAEARFGTVTLTYSDTETGTYTDVMPTTVGEWYMHAVVPGTGNYTALDKTVTFRIVEPVKVPFGGDSSNSRIDPYRVTSTKTIPAQNEKGGKIVITVRETLNAQNRNGAPLVTMLDMEALADAGLTEEENQAVLDGAEVEMRLTVTPSLNTPSDAAGKKLTDSLLSLLPDIPGFAAINQYDLHLQVRVDRGQWHSVYKLNQAIAVRITIPEAYRIAGAKYYVLRPTDGKAVACEIIAQDETSVTILTDCMGTFVLGYTLD